MLFKSLLVILLVVVAFFVEPFEEHKFNLSVGKCCIYLRPSPKSYGSVTSQRTACISPLQTPRWVWVSMEVWNRFRRVDPLLTIMLRRSCGSLCSSRVSVFCLM